MRDFVSCFNEYAIQVSDNTSCSSYSNSSCILPSLIPSTQTKVICIYKVILTNKQHVLINVTWSKTNVTQGLSVHFNNDLINVFKLNANSRFFKKKKGVKFLDHIDGFKIEIFWDLSAVKYSPSGPEPVDGYYIVIRIDSYVGLVLGAMVDHDHDQDSSSPPSSSVIIRKLLKNGNTMAKYTLVSRQEYYSGNTIYSTKVKFLENGINHDVLIRCNNGENDPVYPVLSVYIDKKMVIKVKRLQWNFRGNQSIFIDGLLIDLMWDVHDWFFNPNSGVALFLFRSRSGMDTRLWLDDKEKLLKKDQEKVEFSLLIYASKEAHK